jgi:hypothetical protein
MVADRMRPVNAAPFPRAGAGYHSAMKLIIAIVYVVIGFVVASTHHYFSHMGSVEGIASAILAVVLWPLVLFGVDLHLGETGKAGGKG